MITKSSMRLGIKVLFLGTFFVLVFAPHVMALDATAKTCSKSDVQSAISQVQSAGGGTVFIPAGDCTWSGQPIYVNLTGSINIIGAGIGRTILRLGDTSSSYFWFDLPQTPPASHIDHVRVSGFSFIPTQIIGGYQSYGIITWWYTKSFRFDHNYIEANNTTSFGNTFFLIKNVGKALIDNNWFVQNETAGHASYLWEIGSCYTAYGNLPSNIDCYNEGSNKTGCLCTVGSDAEARTSSVATNNTVIARLYDQGGGHNAGAVINNTGGSGTGKMQRIYFYINSVGAGPTVDIASFYVNSMNTLSTRGSATRIPVHIGLNYLTAGKDFTTFDIRTGDYLGIYLNNCTLSKGAKMFDASTGGTLANGYWLKSGNQIPATSVDFGSTQTGTIALWGEIYDSENVLSACETAYYNWYQTTGDPNNYRTGGDYARKWDANYKPTATDDKAIFYEDNYFQWGQAAIEGNWQNIQKVVIRYNTFQLPPPPYNFLDNCSRPTTKPGSMFTHMHDNIFNYFSFTKSDISFNSNKTISMLGDVNGYMDFRHAFKVGDQIDITGSVSNNKTVTVTVISKGQITVSETLTTEAAGNLVTLNLHGVRWGSSQDAFHMYMTNGLVYNNIFNNQGGIWTLWPARQYGTNTMLIPLTRQTHLYMFNNTGKNNSCGTIDSPNCMGDLQTTNYGGLAGYGTTPGTGTFFFRAPQAGETLYGYADYPYPHPLRSGGAPNPPKNLRIINP